MSLLFNTSAIKRSIDIVLSVIGLVVAFPLMVLIAMAIYAESPGTIFFSQERLGYRGKKFRLYKFRKFPVDWGNVGPGVTVAGDARMTRIGKHLERTKLDELPQLWNIFLGEMSFVGPRPESTQYGHLFTGKFARVLDFVPGIFGPNQITFRNESAMYPPDEDPEKFYEQVLFPEKARADIRYFSSANDLSDLAQIFKGLWVSVIGALDWKWAVRNILPIMTMDLVAIEAAWASAMISRFGVSAFEMPVGAIYLTGVWLLPLVVLPVLLLGGGYLHSIRHIVLRDVLRVAGLVAIGWLIGFLTLLWFETRGTSLALAPAGFLFLAAYTVVPRILYKEYLRRKELNSKDFSELKKVIIFGTDDRAINLGSLIQRGFPTARLVGFLDNSSEVRGRTILDQKVVGSERDLPTLLSVHDFDQLWLSFSPDRIQRQRLESWTLENEVLLVILPEISAFESLFPNLSLTQEMKRPVALGDKIIDM